MKVLKKAKSIVQEYGIDLSTIEVQDLNQNEWEDKGMEIVKNKYSNFLYVNILKIT